MDQIRILAVPFATALILGCMKDGQPLEVESLSPEMESQLKAFFATKNHQAAKLIVLSICLEHEKLIAEILSKLEERTGDAGSGVENSKS